MELSEAAEFVERFSRPDLGLSLAKIESALRGMTPSKAANVLESHGATHEALEGAATLKPSLDLVGKI